MHMSVVKRAATTESRTWKSQTRTRRGTRPSKPKVVWSQFRVRAWTASLGKWYTGRLRVERPKDLARHECCGDNYMET